MISIILIKQYLYLDNNHKRRVASVGNNIIYSYMVIIWHRGISVVRSLKLLALPYPFQKKQEINTIITIILSTNCSYVISPYKTSSFYLKVNSSCLKSNEGIKAFISFFINSVCVIYKL